MKKEIFTLAFVFIYFAVFSQDLYQTVRGTIIDSDSEMPLIGATIQVEGSNPIIAAISDLNGNFILENVPIGRHTFIISYVGYKKQILSEILIGSAKEIVLTIKLKEQVLQINEATIVFKRDKDKTVNEMALVSSRQFTVEETSRYAASLDDPSRMATGFAGVALSGDDIRNEIVIRGNSPRGMLWQIEGVPVPNPNHFAEEGSSGGAVSIISNNVLDNSDFLTGAWPAQYSNAFSGVFDIKLRNGNNYKREYAFQLGLLGVDFAAEGPFSKNSNASYLFNYRYSTLSLFDKIGISILDERDGIPTFQDLTFKFNVPTKKAGIFTFWGIGGNSELKNETIIGFDTTYQGIRFNYLEYDGDMGLLNVGATGFSHKYLIDNKSYIKTSVVLTGSQSYVEDDGRLEPNNAISKIDAEYKEDIHKSRFIASSEYKRKFNSQFTLQSGVRFSKLFYNVIVENWNYDSLIFNTDLDKDGNMNYLELYAQSSYSFSDNLELYTGLNYNQLLSNNTYSVEPRAALNWKFYGNQSLTFGYGIHSQIQSLALYLVDIENEDGIKKPVNKNLEFNKAQHYVLTYNNLLHNDLRLKIDLYYQYLYNIPIPKDTSNNEYLKSYSSINDGGWFTFVPLENKGTGRNYGIEISLEKFFSRGWYALMTTSIFESKYTGKDRIERNTRFNGKYIFNLLGGKEFTIRNNILGTNIKLSYNGGRMYTPIRGEEIVLDENGNPVTDIVSGQQIIIAPYDFSKAFTEKMKDYSRVDFSIFYRINKPKLAHVFTFEFQNLFNISNIGGLSYYDTRNDEYVFWYQTGIIPIFKYRLEF
ncbi:carboxypeptidase-like regulatory domain-containing protein [Bacteroidota bacterium]